jgi:hypothetical protein
MVSFVYLAEREPRLAALHRLLSIVADNIRPDDPHWCANTFWLGTVKPLLMPLVGWERGRSPENASDPAGALSTAWSCLGDLTIAALEGEHRWTRPVETVAEETLRSAAAYDVAVRHLYDLLPPCRDCACVRVQEVAA